MGKTTLEEALRARRADGRALRGSIIMAGNTPQIVFGAVGEHRRFSLKITGDDLELGDDPRDAAPAPEKLPVGGDQVDSGGDGASETQEPPQGEKTGRKKRSKNPE